MFIEINKVLKMLEASETINRISALTTMYEILRLEVVNEGANHELESKYTDN